MGLFGDLSRKQQLGLGGAATLLLLAAVAAVVVGGAFAGWFEEQQQQQQQQQHYDDNNNNRKVRERLDYLTQYATRDKGSFSFRYRESALIR